MEKLYLPGSEGERKVAKIRGLCGKDYLTEGPSQLCSLGAEGARGINTLTSLSSSLSPASALLLLNSTKVREKGGPF